MRGQKVLEGQLRDAWKERARDVPIQSVLHFTPEGLVFGASTVLVPADGCRRLRNLKGQEARILALLSAAYGEVISPRILGNIDRAAKSWREGDNCLAYIHLAHAGLQEPQDPYESARCLFMADALLKTGTSPWAILKALRFDAAYIDAVGKLYNPLEPRVPKGNGRISGQWTRLLSVLAEVTGLQAESLGALGARVLLRAGGVATTFFGLLFIPSPNKIQIEGEVPGMPGLRYSWNRDESQLHLTYDGPDGAQSIFTSQLDDDVFRNQRRQVIGRVLTDGNVAIDLHAIRETAPFPANDNEPQLCPTMSPDSKSGEPGWHYEDFVKEFVNPRPFTTPRGWGFMLPNALAGGTPVQFDDCEHTSGTMIEIKGPGYADMVAEPWGQRVFGFKWFGQAWAQVGSAGARQVRWYFAEPGAADFARLVFMPFGKKIDVEVLPWVKVSR
jgi:hypothetical protein